MGSGVAGILDPDYTGTPALPELFAEASGEAWSSRWPKIVLFGNALFNRDIG